MNDNPNALQINFYFIKSNFKEILTKLCKKLLNESHKSLVSVSSKKEMEDLDKFLWINDKQSFLPHKTINCEITERDNIIITDKVSLPNNLCKKFDTLIISPEKRIKSFEIFRRFLVFSYKVNIKGLENYKKKLKKKGYTIKCFEESQTFKWKVIN